MLWLLSIIVAGVICSVQSVAKDDLDNTTETMHLSLDNNSSSTTNRPVDIKRLDMDGLATDFLPITFQDVDLGPSKYIQSAKLTKNNDDGRQRRSPQRNNEDYDDKYERFKKSFNNRRARGNYRLDDNNDDSGEDEDDTDENEESGSEEQPKKSKKSKNGKNASGADEDYDRIRDESQKAKKSKYCRVERRGNMFCNVCYNPKNGDSAESCSFRQDPHEKKYAFAKEKKYRNKDEPEREREFVTQRPYYPRPRAPYTRPIPAPAYRRPAYTMAYVPRYGYVLAPNRQSPPRNIAFGKSVPKRYIYAGQESRPQREIVGVTSREQQSKDEDDSSSSSTSGSTSIEDVFTKGENSYINRLMKNHTNNEENHDFHPKYTMNDGVDKILAEFKTKDWSRCEHSVKGDLSCYMCKKSNGGKQEECVYDSATQNSNKPYYSELKSYRTSAFGSGGDIENYFKNKKKPAQEKKPIKYMPKKATTPKSKVESTTTGNYNLKTTYGDVEDQLTPEADLFPWDKPGPTEKQAKRMVTATYREENGSPDDARVTVFGHKVIHTV